MAACIKLPDRIANKRFTSKAKALMDLHCNMRQLSVDCLVDIPLIDSSSLALFNALSESLELDAKRIMEHTRG